MESWDKDKWVITQAQPHEWYWWTPFFCTWNGPLYSHAATVDMVDWDINRAKNHIALEIAFRERETR